MSVGPRQRRYDVAFYVPSVAPRLVDEDVPSSGGAETQVLLLARGLAERGLRVCLSAYELPGVELPREDRGAAIVGRPPHRGGRGGLSALAEAVATLRAAFALDGDVLVTRIAGPHVGLVGLVARLRRRRFVYSCANLPELDVSPPVARRGWFLYRLGLRLADSVVVQTQDQLERANVNGIGPARLIPSVRPTADSSAEAPDAFLWAARAVPEKQPLRFVELARALSDARFRMVVAPASSHEDISAEVVQAAKGVPNLELLPALPQHELLALVSRAVAVVNTSDFEGMPNVTLEGWSMGVPALTLTYDPDGLIAAAGLGEFARGSWDEFVAAARRLWDSRFDRDELGRRCIDYVRASHDPDRALDEWLSVLGLRPHPSPVTTLVGAV